MKFKLPLFFLYSYLALILFSCGSANSTKIILNVPGAAEGRGPVVYTAWVEDKNGRNLQNLYVCKTVLGIGKTLTGTALPYWYTTKYSAENPEAYPETDGVTGASSQKPKKIKRALDIDTTEPIRVCLEIDRSWNGNTYFTDRPSFIYKTELIDLDNLSPSYELMLDGFMANDTEDDVNFGQTPPLKPIPGFDEFTYITDLQYIEPIDMVAGPLTVSIK